MLKGVSQEQVNFIIQAIKTQFPNARVLAFGSRVGGEPRKYSDIDICIDNKQKLSWSKLALVEEILEESDIPYVIDISDYHMISEDFRKNIVDKNSVELAK